MMKALVTGASGFIGSTLIEELGLLGFEVHAFMRSTSNPSNLKGLKFKRMLGDLADENSLRKAVQSMDYVFHLAGVTSASKKAAYFEHNSFGTQRLAQAVAEKAPGLSRFVYVSSLAAGGPSSSDRPREENEPDRPVSTYGKSKLLGETELLKYKDMYPISIVRPPLVYGPKDKGVFSVIRTVARNLMPILTGSTKDGHKYYSTIHVKDLCRGIVQAALVPNEKVRSGEIFYLSCDEVSTYQDLLATIAECLDCEPIRFKVPKLAIATAAAGLSAVSFVTRKTFPLNLDKLNEVLPDYWICSNQKARKLLDFAPEFNLATGMSNAIDWYKREKWI